MAIPELRFKKEDGTEYPEWEQHQVGDLFYRKKIRNKGRVIDNVITNSAEYGLVPQRDFFDKDIANDDNTDSYYIIEYGDFVYNPRKSTSAPFGPFNCYRRPEKGIVSPLYTCLTPCESRNADFLLWYFQTNKWHNYIRLNGAQGGARHDRVGMTTELMNGIPVTLPYLEEQQKIADFLSDLDAVISASEDEVVALEQQKKGAMQKIFSQEVRFRRDDGTEYPEWEEKPLAYYLTIRDTKQVPSDDAPLMAFIAYRGISEKGERYDRSHLVKSEDKKYKRTEYNDFIYSSNNLDVGSIGLNKYGTAVISVVYEIFSVNDSAVPDCINAAIQMPTMMNKILSYRQGCLYGQYKIYPEDFLSIGISLPCPEEQQKIADFLSSFDEAIALAWQELEKWKLLKKGLMQQMFV